MLRIWDPEDPSPSSRESSSLSREPSQGDCKLLPLYQALSFWSEEEVTQKEAHLILTSGSRAPTLRCYLGEDSHKTDSSNSMHKETDLVCKRARRTSNLKVICRTVEVVVVKDSKEMMGSTKRRGR